MNVFQHSHRNEKQLARFLARCAVKSLYYEVALFPKPGLVSFMDNGAHQDMNGVLFYRSLFTLRHYFYQVGIHTLKENNQQQLVKIGMESEINLLKVTRGINTHRGAMFALGIMCSSVASLLKKKPYFTSIDLHQHILATWSSHLQTHPTSNNSHGAKVQQLYGPLNGAKEMAMQGYQIVFNIFEELKTYELEPVYFGLRAYCLLLLNIDDTNILYRQGWQGLIYARKQAASLLTQPNTNKLVQQALHVHHDFSRKNISPGGVADLLGLIYFLKELFKGLQ